MKKLISAALVGISTSLLTPIFALAATNPTLQVPITSCVSGKPQIALRWNTVTGAKSYTVLRLEEPQTQWLTRYSLVRGVNQTDKYVKKSTTYRYQVKVNTSSGSSLSNIVSIATSDCTTVKNSPTPTPSPTPTQPTTPVAPTTPATNEKTFTAYLTGYGWPDNTPASAAISNGVIHTLAGGTGTYTDPITIAVGHSIIAGKDILDYPAGTKFYIPALKRYFIVEDTCGDGNSPQNGPCHTGYQGHVWLDAWVGGTSAQAAATLACEDKITDLHTVIQDPSANYTVVSGPIFNGTCTTIFGETATTN